MHEVKTEVSSQTAEAVLQRLRARLAAMSTEELLYLALLGDPCALLQQMNVVHVFPAEMLPKTH